MNMYAAKARRTPTGWQPMIRRVHKANYEPVKSKGKVIERPTQAEAENVALRCILEIINTDIRAWIGEIPDSMAEIEKVFGKAG